MLYWIGGLTCLQFPNRRDQWQCDHFGPPATRLPVSLVDQFAIEALVIDHFSARRVDLVLILFENDIPGNPATARKYMEMASEKFVPDRTHVLSLRQSRIREFTEEFNAIIRSFSPDVDMFGIDISGMPSYLIFAVLNSVRENRSYQNQKIIYTSAKHYTPTKEEYESLKDKQGDDIEYIPKSMAL
jgi:hypothetical protein